MTRLVLVALVLPNCASFTTKLFAQASQTAPPVPLTAPSVLSSLFANSGVIERPHTLARLAEDDEPGGTGGAAGSGRGLGETNRGRR